MKKKISICTECIHNGGMFSLNGKIGCACDSDGTFVEEAEEKTACVDFVKAFRKKPFFIKDVELKKALSEWIESASTSMAAIREAADMVFGVKSAVFIVDDKTSEIIYLSKPISGKYSDGLEDKIIVEDKI